MRLVKYFLIAIFLLLFVFIGVAYYGFQTFLEAGVGQGQKQQAIEINVEPGDRLKDVITHLSQNGFIEPVRAELLYAYARGFEKGNNLKMGKHVIEAGLTPDEFLDKLSQTTYVSQVKFTVVEGLKLAEVIEKIKSSGLFVNDLPSEKTETIGKTLNLKHEHAEGLILPETYFISPQTKASQFIKRAANDLNEVLIEAWNSRDEGLPYKTPYEALILASIVEKETANPKERPLIAGVFVNRLRKGMMLQTDPTIIYGMGDAYNGNIRKKDLRTDTPYNTYTRYGLTPTPISLASREAIYAVMHPQATDKLYFVAKYDGTGEHYFSKTLKEHNQAVRKYILKK